MIVLQVLGPMFLIFILWCFSLLINPNDWRPVWVYKGIWEMTGYGPEGEYKYEDYSWYEIKYSPSRERYKIKMRGRKPKQHRAYKTAIDKLNEFYETTC